MRGRMPSLLGLAAPLSLNALVIAAAVAGIAWLVVQLRVVVVPASRRVIDVSDTGSTKGFP